MFTILFETLQAQEKGINFEQNYKWKEILTKAKKNNKYIFVDCYTTWCIPCKFMDANVFPKEEVGKFYNDNFINVKYQFDSTTKDSPETKENYADVSFLRKEYNVKAYPTYLFFNSNGELVHRELGASDDAKFILKGKNALNQQTQFYTQVKKYDSGYRDAKFLKNLALLSLPTLEESVTAQFAKEYISLLPNLDNPEDLKFINETTNNVSDTGFTIMLNHLSKFESAIGKNELEAHLKMLITNAEFLNNADFESWTTKSWNKFSKMLINKYPLFGEEVLLNIQTNGFQRSNKWLAYSESIDTYLHRHSLSPNQLNEYAWTVFKKCSDKKILKKALGWSKNSFINQPKIEPGYIDTYANLLYKIGRRKGALDWEMKAQKIAMGQRLEKNWGQEVIDKMNKGEKTW